MDDVWKELSLSSLAGSTAGISSAGMGIQEFLARPCSLNPTTPRRSDIDQSDEQRDQDAPNSSKRNNRAVENASERKRRRLMKNRESAVRSRARKQAYTYELELEVASLMKENAMLRQQQLQPPQKGNSNPNSNADNYEEQHPRKVQKLYRTRSI